MQLKQIEDIATKQVPVWQPALLGILLLLGFFAVPLISKQTTEVSPVPKSKGNTLGVATIQKKINDTLVDVGKPLAAQIQKEAGVVLGLAQEAVSQTVQNVASQSANQASEFVFDNTLGKLLQNINALPASQQDLIKKAICK